MVPDDLKWIDYPIFISSTFRDMDSERDAIKFSVIPRLNEKYYNSRLQFHAIDLRVGINTEQLREEEREKYVLDICLEKIKQSRPFFIGLLGDRYGWIPDKDRWSFVLNKLSLNDRPLLKGSEGCSVTELEILYGAIGCEGQNLNRSIFMIRSKKTYENIPLKYKATFQDEYNESISPEHRLEIIKKLAKLKERIMRVSQNKNIEGNIISYDLEWNRNTNRFENLNSFSDKLFVTLCTEIEKEIKQIPQSLFTWQKQDCINVESVYSKLLHDCIETRNTKNIISLLVRKNNQLLIVGDSGSGISTAAAICWQHFKEKDYICCLARIGSSYYSIQMRPILTRWIQQLVDSDDGNFATEKLLDASQTSEVQLYEQLGICVRHKRNEGKNVAFILDGIEQLSNYNINELYQMWIDSSMTVVLTAHRSVSDIIMKHHSRMCLYEMQMPSIDEITNLLKCESIKGNIDLPNEIEEGILSQPQTPLQIKLLFQLFSQLSISDFKNIRNQVGTDDMAKINQYLISIYKNAPKEPAQLAQYAIKVITKRMNLPTNYERFFLWMAASKIGMREKDYEALIGADYDSLHFHSLLSVFNTLIVGDNFSHYWNIANNDIKDVLIQTDEKKLYNELCHYLLSLPDTDRLKREILLYCLIKNEEYNIGIDYLGSYTKYAGDKDLNDWLHISTRLLMSDPQRLKHLQALVVNMPPKVSVTFVYYLIESGVKDITKRDETILWTDTLLDSISINKLDRRSAFQFAILYLHAQQYEKYAASSKRKTHLQKALDALEFCLKLDNDSQNVKDFYCIAITEMADIAMQSGEYDQANRLLQKAFSIQ